MNEFLIFTDTKNTRINALTTVHVKASRGASQPTQRNQTNLYGHISFHLKCVHSVKNRLTHTQQHFLMFNSA